MSFPVGELNPARVSGGFWKNKKRPPFSLAWALKMNEIRRRPRKPLSDIHKEKLRMAKLGKPLSSRHRKSISKSSRGSKSPNWKGGLTKLQTIIRHSFPYKKWRELVFERDNYTCVECNHSGGNLNADHINPYSKIIYENNILSFEEALNCKELWDIKNGRTLCVSCHKKTPTYLRRWYHTA